jgi:hypothetical protein
MRLPKELTTVTTTSKYLALFLFLMLPIIAFIYGKSYQKTLDQANQPVQTETALQITPASIQATKIPTWKTFTNNEYLFRFQYPPQFTVTQIKSARQASGYAKHDKTSTIVTFHYLFSTGKMISGKPDSSGFFIDIFPTSGSTIAQLFENEQGPGGKIGVTPLLQRGDAAEAALLTNTQALRVYRSGDYFFTILPDKSDAIYPFMNQIMSTLTFQH